jgi:hypothetical protein
LKRKKKAEKKKKEKYNLITWTSCISVQHCSIALAVEEFCRLNWISNKINSSWVRFNKSPADILRFYTYNKNIKGFFRDHKKVQKKYIIKNHKTCSLSKYKNGI